MPKFKYDKLVRDKIVDDQIASGAKPKFRQLSLSEHKQALVKKIIEEAQEMLSAEDGEMAGEIADVQQALNDFKELCGVASADVAQAQAHKNAKKGAFKKGLFVERVELGEDDPWTAYYRKNPDRYPEIR